MPKRSWKKTLIKNLTSRRRNSSQEHLEEHRHRNSQVTQTSHSEDSFQEYLHENNQVSARPTRAAKVRCLLNMTNIVRAEKSCDIDVLRERVAQPVANENSEQRERRLQDLRQRAAQREANENNEVHISFVILSPHEDLKNYHKPVPKPTAKLRKIPPTLTLKPLDKKDVPRGVRLIKLMPYPNKKITLNKKIKQETTTPSTSAANQIPIKNEIEPISTSLVYEDDVIDSLQHVIIKEEVDLKPDYIQCDNDDGYIVKTDMDKQTSNGDLLVEGLNYDSRLTSTVDVHIKEETIS